MKPLRYPTLLGLSICLCLSAITKTYAQDIDEDFFKYYLSQNVYAIDSEAGAVVLYEKNTVEVSFINKDFIQTQRVYKIIKILKASALGCGNISDSYKDEYGYNCYIGHIKGTTYNLEGDQIVKTSLSKSDIYSKKIEGQYNKVEFSLPAMKEGSIIEYYYEKVTPLSNLLPAWNIQGPYPKLRSIYDISFPVAFSFTPLLQLNAPFKKYDNERVAEASKATSYFVSRDDFDNHKTTWVRLNVPAIKEESYSSGMVNNRERMELQLTTVIRNHIRIDRVDKWEKFDEQWWGEHGIGKQLKAPNRFLDDITDSLTRSCTSDVDKAKAIFKYVRSNFTANNSSTLYTKKVLSTVFNDKGGSKAEINLLLIAMLRNGGVNALPVLLSTVGNLRATEVFPIKDRFNYIICAVKLDADKLLLDASNKYNAFNVLPPYCYNGYARLVDEKGEGLMLTPDDIKERWVTAVQVSDISDSGMKVSVTEKLPNTISANLREKWAKDDKGLKSYVREQTEGYTGTVTIVNSEALFLDDPDTNLVVTYTCNTKNDKHNARYYLNTDFIKFFKANPFKEMERKLPIEFPYKMDYMCAMTMQLPKEFKLEEIPKPKVVDYENGEISYKKLTDYNDNMHWLTINTHFITNQTFYSVENYAMLRQFFDKMIREENDMLTLEKVENK